nr:FCD domain-containing protein [Nitratireductor luteus]
MAKTLLRRDIIEGRWPPSEWLRLQELRKEYNLGSSPLREALTGLAGEGLIEFAANRGFRLKPLTRSDLLDIEWMRVTVETAALRQSIAKGGVEWKAEVVGALYRLKDITLNTATDKEGLDAWNDEHDEFHKALISACGSPRALEIQRRLADQHRRYRIALMDENMNREEIIEQHTAIADATVSGKTEEAVELLERNLRTTTEFYSSVLDDRMSDSEKKS